MPLIDAYVAELDHESATTRRLLERMPEDRADWKPHDKSMTLGRLCGHIAEMPGWGTTILRDEQFDMAAAREQGFEAFVARDRAGLLERFDREVAQLREAAGGVGDEHLAGSWALRMGEQELYRAPRAVALRTWVLNHVVHHRGQLAVYLRLLDVPVPAIYGPSADEQPAR